MDENQKDDFDEIQQQEIYDEGGMDIEDYNGLENDVFEE